MRIGLVGCGHIGTVHAVALQQLADAELVDARLTATFDDDAGAGGEGGAPPRRRAVRRRSTALLDAVDVVWVCTWTAAHLAAVEAAADRGLPIFCEKPLAPDLATATRVAAALERVPHQVGLVLRWAPVFRNLADAVAIGRVRPRARGRDARRPVLPGAGPLRLDVARRRRARGRRHASSSTRSTTSTCCAGRSAIRSRSRRARRRASDTRASRTPPR